MRGTYGVNDLTELGEGIPEAVIIGGPGETAGQVSTGKASLENCDMALTRQRA